MARVRLGRNARRWEGPRPVTRRGETDLRYGFRWWKGACFGGPLSCHRGGIPSTPTSAACSQTPPRQPREPRGPTLSSSTAPRVAPKTWDIGDPFRPAASFLVLRINDTASSLCSSRRQSRPGVLGRARLLHEVVIAAGIRHDPAAIHMQNLGGEPADEMHVVGNEHQGAFVAFQRDRQ